MATITLTTAQAGSPSSVQTVINAATSGDTIVFPAGTYSWSAGITVGKSLTLTGPPGTTNQVLFQNQMTTGYMWALTSGTDGHIRVNGINFIQIGNNAGSASVACLGLDRTDMGGPGSPGTQYTVISTNCSYDSGAIFNYMIIALANGLLWSNCTFTNQFSSLGLTGISFTMPKYGITTWNKPSTMGLVADSLLGPGGSDHINVGDTAQGWCGIAGLNNCYIEDSVIQNGTSGTMNVDDNARVVVRHCTCNDVQLFSHGQDSSQYGGRQFEIYNNVFTVVNSGLNNQGWTSFRGCTGLVANNTMPLIPGKVSVTFECQQLNRGVGPAACQTAYPANRQVGSGWSSSSSVGYGNPVLSSDGIGYVLDPFYIFGNTGTGATAVGVANFSPGQTDTCGNGIANSVPFTATLNGTNTLSAITITPQTGLTPRLTTGMGIYDASGKIPQGTFITAIAGSATAPTSITMSAAATGSATGLALVSGFITQGRDFIVGTARPGWVPYTYPHPLFSMAVLPGTPSLYDHVETGMDNVDVLGTLSIPLPGPVGSGLGNLLICGVQCSTSYTIVSVKDDQGNAFTAGPTNTGSGKRMAAFFLPNCAGGIRYIRVAFSGSGFGYPHATVDQWTNILQSSPLDGSAISMSAKSLSLSPTTNGDLIWQWGIALSTNANGAAFNGSSITAGSGFILSAADLQVGSCKQYQVQATAATITAAFTTSGSATWGTIAMAFKSATAGTPPPSGIRVFGVHTLSLSDPNNLTGANVLNVLQFPAIGNLVAINYQSYAHKISGITDNKSNTWTIRSGAFNSNGGGFVAQICFAANATTGAGYGGITFAFTGTAGYDVVQLFDIVNAQSSPFDTESNAFGQQIANGNLSTVAITPSTINGLVISNTVIDFNTIADTVSAATGYISDVVVHDKLDNNVGPNTTLPSSLCEDGGYAHVYNSSLATLTFVYSVYTFAATGNGGNYNGVQFWSATAVAFKGVAVAAPTQATVGGRLSVSPTAGVTHKALALLG